MVWYSHLFQNFPQFIVIHTVKGFGIVNKAEIVVFIELSCTSRHILIKLTKIKYKEQILKAARAKQQIIHKRIPIRITADLSIETLQARREWWGILKVMKEKKTQTQITVPSKDLIQIWRRNQKLYRQTTPERIQHHQTSSPSNAKGSSLDRKHRKGVETRAQNNKVNGNGIILINNYLKCKWVESPKQKTKTGWMATKIRPLYMLSTRDPSQNRGHIQT